MALTKEELTKNVDKVMPPEMRGFPGWLSVKEVACLESLRSKLVDQGLFHRDHVMDDKHLLRFLRARKFDLEKTFKMLAADLEWRREFENRTIHAEESPIIAGFCDKGFLYRAGRDKDGRPVLVMKCARVFPRSIKDQTEVVLYCVAYMHGLTLECEKYGVTDCTLIADLAHFSPSKNFSLAITKLLINLLQTQYPDRLAHM